MFKIIIRFFLILFISINLSFADDPLLDRARAYLDSNKLKVAVENYGIFSGTSSPQGLWGGFQYISNLSLIVGIPGKDKNGNPYPWAIGKKQTYLISENRFEETGTDTTYWGPTVSESWFDRTTNLNRTDWDAIEGSKNSLHNPLATAGAYYGSVGLYTSEDDLYPLIAASDIPDTWPDSAGTKIWPGHWAIDPNDPSGSEELEGTFVSDKDIYFEIDDRFATRDVDTSQGYSIGLKVEVSGYTFSDSTAEDLVFFNIKIINESEFNYKDVYAGFYFDVDSYNRLANGSYAGRTNDDDMMSYNNELDFAYIYDLDGDHSNPYVGDKKLAYSAIKLLDTPLSSDSLDLNIDGVVDIFPGDKLGLTSWHWFDWYFRPGARDKNPTSGPWSGDGQTPVAENKEEIQYKILAGDISNLSGYDSTHYFHPPRSDSGIGEVNPRFDSVAGLQYEYPDGLDCVFIMASGPFSMTPGESIPFSFCLIMGEDENELTANAQSAQNIFDNNFRIITALENNSNSVNLLRFILNQNYPNPFNPETTISFFIKKSGDVKLTIYNTLGQKVVELIDEYKSVGEYQVVFNAHSLPSGVYYYRLEIDGFEQVKKMLVLK